MLLSSLQSSSWSLRTRTNKKEVHAKVLTIVCTARVLFQVVGRDQHMLLLLLLLQLMMLLLGIVMLVTGSIVFAGDHGLKAARATTRADRAARA